MGKHKRDAYSTVRSVRKQYRLKSQVEEVMSLPNIVVSVSQPLFTGSRLSHVMPLRSTRRRHKARHTAGEATPQVVDKRGSGFVVSLIEEGRVTNPHTHVVQQISFGPDTHVRNAVRVRRMNEETEVCGPERNTTERRPNEVGGDQDAHRVEQLGCWNRKRGIH